MSSPLLRGCALLAMALPCACRGDRPFHTVAVYEAPLSRCAIRMEARGVVRGGDDVSVRSSAVLTFTRSGGADPDRRPPVTTQAALREGWLWIGNQRASPGRQAGEAISPLLEAAGCAPIAQELEELGGATEGVLLGPKGTMMSGQTRALRVVSTTFDR